MACPRKSTHFVWDCIDNKGVWTSVYRSLLFSYTSALYPVSSSRHWASCSTTTYRALNLQNLQAQPRIHLSTILGLTEVRTHNDPAPHARPHNSALPLYAPMPFGQPVASPLYACARTIDCLPPCTPLLARQLCLVR